MAMAKREKQLNRNQTAEKVRLEAGEVDFRQEFTKHTFTFRHRFTYKSLFLVEHFCSNKFVEFAFGGVRQRNNERMLQHVQAKGNGRIIPIDRVKNLSREDFFEKYAKPGIPVVFEGLAKDWPAVKTWSLEWVADQYGDDDCLLVDAEGTNSNPLGKPFEFITLRELIGNIDKGGMKYARFHPLLQVHPELRDDLDKDWLNQHMYKNLSNWMTFFAMFMGGAGTNSGVHNAANANLFIQVEGRKYWRFYPMTAMPMIHPKANRAPYKVSELLPDAVDEKTYPMYPYLDHYETILEPGDVMYNPPYVWHHVGNLDRSIGVATRWTNITTAFRVSKLLLILEFLNTRPHVLKTVFNTLDDFNKILANTNGDEKALRESLKNQGKKFTRKSAFRTMWDAMRGMKV